VESSGFGFLGGSEILKDVSANLGLLDQYLGLEWIADNVAKSVSEGSYMVSVAYRGNSGIR
jgi:hypothetical protein